MISGIRSVKARYISNVRREIVSMSSVSLSVSVCDVDDVKLGVCEKIALWDGRFGKSEGVVVIGATDLAISVLFEGAMVEDESSASSGSDAMEESPVDKLVSSCPCSRSGSVESN